MLTSGSIDEEVYELIEKKRSVVDAAVDGGEIVEENTSLQLILNLMDKLG
jgi:SNF2 family DNA or RNA helicase